MTWTDDDETRIIEIMNTCSTTEVIASAIGNIIDAKIGIEREAPSRCVPIDCSRRLDFNERLLCAALDELRKGRVDEMDD